LSVLAIVLLFGTLDLGVIVERQCHNWLGFIPAWNIFTQPLAFLLFLVCIHAEANRAPFDLAEAEQELSEDTTPNTAACGSRCSSSQNTPV